MAKTVTIADGASLSGAASIPEGHTLTAVLIPATWTAAGVTFQGAVDQGATYKNVFNTAGEVAFATDAAGRFLVCKPEDFHAVRFVKVRSGTAAAAVNQVGADRVVELVFTRH